MTEKQGRLKKREGAKNRRRQIEKFTLTVLLSQCNEPVNGDLSAQHSLPLEVDNDEKQDQKATVNNSFCSKTKPAGPLGNKGGG